jgi:LuxR family transcriptional regulator, maltose regulon positive regulatory protein
MATRGSGREPAQRRRARFSPTKFAAPAPPKALVPRRGLLDRLDRAEGPVVRVVVGSPGSGKTCLLADWASRLPAGGVAWMNADSADGDPLRCWQAILTSLQRCSPGLGSEALDLLALEDEIDPDVFESLLIDAESLDQPVTLVVDDFHLAAEVVGQHLGFLAARGLRGIRLVLGTRVDPPGLARLRVSGQLDEIREDQLRMDRDEVARLVKELELEVTNDELDVLTDRTEGWVAGVQLAAVTMRSQDSSSEFVRDLETTSQAVSQYLTAELVNSQTPEVRRFLLDTCVVDELTPALASHLSPGNPVTLSLLEEANLMVVRLDPGGGVFRYHHLFAEVLRRLLDVTEPEHAVQQHRRAAEWFQRSGDHPAAFRHAWRAGMRDQALDVVHQSVLDSFFSGRGHSVAEVVPLLSDDDLRASPGPSVSLGLALALEGEVEAAHALTDRVDSLVGAGLDPAEEVQLLATRCLTSLATDDSVACLEIGGRLLATARTGGVGGEWPVVGRNLMVRAACWIGDVARATELAEDLPRGGPGALEMVETRCTVAHLRLAQGRPLEAEKLARSALEAAVTTPEQAATLEMLPRALLGTALLETGRVSEAAEELRSASESSGDARRPTIVLCRLGLSRIWQSEGNSDAALLVLDEARHALRHTPRRGRFAQLIDAREAHILLRAGEPDRVASIVDELDNGIERSVLTALVLSARGRPDEGLALLGDLQDEEAPVPARLAVALARLSCAVAAGQPTEGDAGVVIDLSTGGGQLFAIAEAGSEVLGEVCSVARRLPQTDHLKRLMLTRPHATPAALPVIDISSDALSERERTVLRYLVTAMSYREIADELFVSVNTVKTHVKNIIRKLHADSRADAIRRARELRYL